MEFKLDMNKLAKVIEDSKQVHNKLDSIAKESCLEILNNIENKLLNINKLNNKIIKQYFAKDGTITGELTINNKTNKEEFFIVIYEF